MVHSRWIFWHVTSHKWTPFRLLQFYPVWRKLFGFLGGKGTPGDVVQDLLHDGFWAAQTAAISIHLSPELVQELASQLLGLGHLVQVAVLARKFHEISIIIGLHHLESLLLFPAARLESRLNQDDTNHLTILGQGGVWWGMLQNDARRRSHQGALGKIGELREPWGKRIWGMRLLGTKSSARDNLRFKLRLRNRMTMIW